MALRGCTLHTNTNPHTHKPDEKKQIAERERLSENQIRQMRQKMKRFKGKEGKNGSMW